MHGEYIMKFLIKLLIGIYIFLKYNLNNFIIFFIIDMIPFQNVKIFLLKHTFIRKIGKNTVIMPKVRWYNGNNIIIGNNVFINIYTYLDDKNIIKIGNNVWIGCYVKIITADHIKENMEEIDKPVFIGDFCWIGANVLILPGVKIGNNCIIGAGSVVTKDIPDNSIAVGNPAKVIKKRNISFPYKTCSGYISSNMEGKIV